MKHSSMNFRLREIVKFILLNSHKLDLTLQGFGMLRISMGDCRIHVWDKRFAVHNVSEIHDHRQWNFESTILSGRVKNRVFKISVSSEDPTHHCAVIEPGINAHVTKRSKDVRLLISPSDCGIYNIGDTYSMSHDAIHQSIPDDGTVTFMRKIPTGINEARTFWPIGTEWVSAKPRAATKDEVKEIVGNALDKWDSDEDLFYL